MGLSKQKSVEAITPIAVKHLMEMLAFHDEVKGLWLFKHEMISDEFIGCLTAYLVQELKKLVKQGDL